MTAVQQVAYEVEVTNDVSLCLLFFLRIKCVITLVKALIGLRCKEIVINSKKIKNIL